ncbi:glycosyltransferase family 9 protein [Roseomonas sp. NAR14]|uniref:Glycosyltransferase family 9 protein n=1 Tax=Roseomonas acroporae TaxID=2937791 RepID=A0A9X1YAN8_9PROT|nr:glycosyltransferase family 9 protein [Roseomonas acroporae]MCK8782986.1 glycosyltransferase family 9 protein [Roseomonas acroporae]
MRILFVTSNRLGDAVLTTGLLDHLVRAHPDAAITVVCGPVAAPLFDRMPNREATIVLEKRPYGMHWAGLYLRVVRQRWDLVVDLRGGLLGYTVWTRRRAVQRGGWRGGHRIRQIGAVLGLDPPPRPVAWWAPADAARAASLLPEAVGGGAPWIALGPTANWSGKLWPADRFAALFRALAAPDGPLPGARAVVFGGPGPAERAMAAPLLAALAGAPGEAGNGSGGGAVDLVGGLSLAEVAAALARCALFVGNDSGLMHLAAAAGTPTLGLFGPTPAAEYAPVGRCAAAVLADGPLGAAPMASLPVETALRAARTLLAAPPAPVPALVGAAA